MGDDVVCEMNIMFKYIGTVVQKNGGFEEDVGTMIMCRRIKWREVAKFCVASGLKVDFIKQL